MTKTCCRCALDLPVADFYRNKRSADGFAYRCKACDIARVRERQLANREAEKQRSLAYYESHKEEMQQSRRERYAARREEENEQSRAYHERNREAVLERQAAYRRENAGYFARWKRENRARIAASNASRRSRLANAPEGQVTEADLLDMLESQGYLCAYCECSLDEGFHLEHMTPLCRGGVNDWTNVAVSCPRCNLSKGRSTAEEFTGRGIPDSCAAPHRRA